MMMKLPSILKATGYLDQLSFTKFFEDVAFKSSLFLNIIGNYLTGPNGKFNYSFKILSLF
jgi:hypothetical protein